jgi:hypothetical protein
MLLDVITGRGYCKECGKHALTINGRCLHCGRRLSGGCLSILGGVVITFICIIIFAPNLKESRQIRSFLHLSSTPNRNTQPPQLKKTYDETYDSLPNHNSAFDYLKYNTDDFLPYYKSEKLTDDNLLFHIRNSKEPDKRIQLINGLITDTGLEYLRNSFELRMLQLNNCNEITDDGLEFLKGLTQLQILDLRDCDKITDAGVLDLQLALPNCVVYK